MAALMGICAGLAAGCAMGQEAGPQTAAGGPEVIFKATAPHATALSYTFQVHKDGSGSFAAGPGSQGAGGSAESGGQSAPVPLAVSAKTAESIFGQVQALRHMGFACGTKMKGVADMGTKWVEYRGPDGVGSCTYNYTENKAAAALADTFSGIALTLEEGRKLAFLHQFDRLGLNEEMGNLYSEAQSGRALELGTIAPVLQSLVNDMEVMERVRLKAASLLKMAGVAG